MTRLRLVLAVAPVARLGLGVPGAVFAAEEPVTIEVFWAEGCPYCAAELEFLADLSDRYPEVEVVDYEVSRYPVNAALFEETMAAGGREAVAVPTTVLSEHVWVGFDSSIASEIEATVAAMLASIPVQETEGEVVDLPFLGSVDVGSASLLVATLVIGFVDGLNPCSLWVLSVLLALVLRSGSRRRVLAIGGTFLTVTAALYGLYIAGMYGALSFLAHQTWVRMGMAVVALAFGLVNLKDFFAFGRGISVTIPESRKPKLYRKMREVAVERQSLLPAVGGTVALAVGVSVLETPCTAGYPLLWADLLASHGVDLAGAAALFAVYMAVFLLDEFAVFLVATFAMRAFKLEEKGGRILKLISGLVMVALAGTLVFAPEAMSSVGGAAAVFGAAVVAGCVVLVADRLRSRQRSAASR